jgi:FkbM family methyltransferase
MRRTAGWTVDLLSGLLGRRQVVRAARFALHRARLDVPNDPAGNGEHALQRWVLRSLPAEAPITVLDGRLRLHAFEPVAETYRLLCDQLPASVLVRHLAMSDQSGEITMHVLANAGTNSLYETSMASSATHPEKAVATTVDDYRSAHDLTSIDLLKIDTEGHDLAVLRGAEKSLRQQAITVVQFEYNHRWVPARYFLKDAFDLLLPLGYRLGKLTPRGMESYPAWDPELETFIEGNYLACTEEFARMLPQVPWWKVPAWHYAGTGR